MTTDELIKALRDLADECEDRKLIVLLDEAADRMEELDERVSIMTADHPGRRGEEKRMKVRIGTAYGKAFEFSGERVVFEDGKIGMRCTVFNDQEVETASFSSPHINVKIYSKRCNYPEIDDYDQKKHSGLMEEET